MKCRAKPTSFYTYVNLRKFQKRLCIYLDLQDNAY